jgi:hypothetical protein
LRALIAYQFSYPKFLSREVHMKFAGITFFLLVLICSAVAVRHSDAAQRRIHIVGPIEPVTFGPLINAPNGHISFQKEPGGYRLWLPGRLRIASQNIDEEGGFMFDVKDWSIDDLSQAQATFMDLGHIPVNCDPNDFSFDRNYLAPNAVVPGMGQTLLTIYDAEYHVACPSGQPLLSSIGLGTSTDGGVTWTRQGQIIQGLDQARKGFTFVTQRQLNEFNNGRNLDDGASGPSAVVREADGCVYIYLYYADRTPITGGPDSIYLARALLATNGMPGNWQQWTGAGWGAVGDQTSAAPIVAPSTTALAALQPHVSWNTALHSWLMVFKTKIDFEVATSVDGLNWSQASSLLTFDPHDKETGFPTLISPNGGACEGFGCNDDTDLNPWLLQSERKASQQITNTTGWLFYSSHPENNPQYIGHRAPFRVNGD